MKTPQVRAIQIHTPNVFRQIARLCTALLALLIFAELSPTVMAMLADQSVQRGMIAQAQAEAAEHYLSILLN
ncbi:hypothetical protein [Mesorhizobium sp. 113-3-3]|uniref:hypothetical protein n=1 Tax=Mesorhizobium sp. 113-3-3 TaxID=2744516 RepID=UPI001928140E|nr:hypothetical protein [Mesorhizobium sp. 113-3-3]BCG82123.1 hypothetical protein MesoLj113b_56650 [Mesorhizobium sp. 113-3-3]